MSANRKHYAYMLASIFAAMLGLIASAGGAHSESHVKSPIQSALESPDRFAGDSDEDARRKSGDVLAMLGAGPGMVVLDFFAGGGYNSELLARIVGPSGSVIAYNSPGHVKRSGEKLAKRFGDNRLANVKQLIATPDELQLPASSLDGALIVMAYHDLYHSPRDAATPPSDIGANVKAITASLFEAMKPGGVIVIVDHAANEGGDITEIADTLHRIGPQVVRAGFTAAGFTLDGESMALRNPADDHSKPVFDASVRHMTDRFIFRFRKPR